MKVSTYGLTLLFLVLVLNSRAETSYVINNYVGKDTFNSECSLLMYESKDKSYVGIGYWGSSLDFIQVNRDEFNEALKPENLISTKKVVFTETHKYSANRVIIYFDEDLKIKSVKFGTISYLKPFFIYSNCKGLVAEKRTKRN